VTKSSEFMDWTHTALTEAAKVPGLIEARCLNDIARIAEACTNSLHNGGRLFFCGNGGSAAESQHFATELVVRLSAEVTRQALPAMALTTDTSTLTACSNDFGFETVFARQVEAHVRQGDVLFLLSTSGRSPNLLQAAKASREGLATNIGLLGQDQTPLDTYLDIALHIPSTDTQRIQEAHLLCGHILIHLIETELLTSK